MDKKLTCLAIGDPHFKPNMVVEGEEFIDRVVQTAEMYKPTFIVILGDTLHTHDVSHVAAYNLAINFLDKLYRIAPVKLIIGNHDYSNNQQFCSDSHFFNPMKNWGENLEVVDYPKYCTFIDSQNKNRSFVFCPYTPPGTLINALTLLYKDDNNCDFRNADAIFVHQEMNGCTMNQITSNEGDKWFDELPPIISGHIHDEQVVGTNVFYPGSSIQHSFGEGTKKRIWLIDWEPENCDTVFSKQGFEVKKINLCMKTKKQFKYTIQDFKNAWQNDKDLKICLETQVCKIFLFGTPAEIKEFNKSETKKKLTMLNVKIVFKIIENENFVLQAEPIIQSFDTIFQTLVKQSPDYVQDEYKNIFG